MDCSPNGTRRRASAAVGVFLACATVGRGETALLARQSAWRYADTGANLSTAWRTPSYDDSAWSTGSGQFGYGDGDETTVVSYGSDPAQKHITTYFRTRFVVTDPGAFALVTLSVLRDDGAAVYLNGTRVLLSNLPTSYSYTTRASAQVNGAAESNYLSQTLSPSLLVAGTNVLAAEVHISSRTDDDMSFDAGLVAVTSNETARLVVSSPWGSPTPPRGTNMYALGSVVPCSVSPAAVTASGGTTQYVCTGWTITGLTSGAGASVAVTLTNDATLNWEWATNVWLASAMPTTGGWVFGANRWLRRGGTSQVDAVTFGHYRFGGWSGDVPTNQVDDNPLAMIMDRARVVQPNVHVHVDTNGVMDVPSVSLAGPGVLSHFQVETNLALGGTYPYNMSACCLMPSTGELLVIVNTPPQIHVYTPDGVYRRTIALSGFADTEGICQYRSESNLFAIVEEGSESNHSDICVVTITSNTTVILKSSATVIPAGRKRIDNNGWEGIAYDPVHGWFYLVKERVPMGVYRVFASNGTYLTEEVFNATTAFAGLATDLSDIRYDPESGHLWILSDEGKRVMECDLAGRVLSTLHLTAVQPEGIEFTPDRRTLYVAGEPDEYFRYARRPTAGTVMEGDGIDLTAVLSWPWTGAVSVAYLGTGGLALAGQDFAPATGRLDFAAGVTSATFHVDVPLDDESEPDEAFTLELAQPSNAVLGIDTGYVVTIPSNTPVTLTVRSALGGATPPVGTHRYNAGAAPNCAVTNSPLYEGAWATQFACVGWVGEGSVPTQGVGTSLPGLVLTTDSTIGWLWDTNLYLSFTPEGSGAVDAASGWYRLGTGVVATAAAAVYHHFDGWSGDLPAGAATGAATLSVTADVPRAVTAHFGADLAAYETPEWWLARYGATGDYDEAALADTDGDRAVAWQEYRAGTDPTRGASVLRLTGIALAPDGSARIAWSGGSNRFYRAERTDDMNGSTPDVLASNIPATATGLVTDADAPARSGAFYRITVEWP